MEGAGFGLSNVLRRFLYHFGGVSYLSIREMLINEHMVGIHLMSSLHILDTFLISVQSSYLIQLVILSS